MPNFIEIVKTIRGRTDGRTAGRTMTSVLLGRLGGVDLITLDWTPTRLVGFCLSF